MMSIMDDTRCATKEAVAAKSCKENDLAGATLRALPHLRSRRSREMTAANATRSRAANLNESQQCFCFPDGLVPDISKTHSFIAHEYLPPRLSTSLADRRTRR